MNRISNSKNLIKKISIFFLFFSIFVFTKARADVYIRNNIPVLKLDHILATTSNSTSDNTKINTDVLEGNHSFKYLFLKGYNIALKKDYIDIITLKYNKALESITNDPNKDKEKIDLDNIKNNIIKLEGNSESFLDKTYNYVFTTLRNDKDHGYVMSYGGTNQINAITNKARRLYMYYYFNDQILPIAIKYKDSTNTSLKDIYTYTTDKIEKLKNGASDNAFSEEDPLKEEEILNSYITTNTFDTKKGVFIGETDNIVNINVTPSADIFKLPITTNRQVNSGTGTTVPPDAVSAGNSSIVGGNFTCDKNVPFMDFTIIGDRKDMFTEPGCNPAAYIVNIMIKGVNGLVTIFVDLAGNLFDWIYDKGVIKFGDWVTDSGAYVIYKTIILSLIVSVMTFFVFYLIIRRLIDDDGEKMNKILPRLILTALFVYFSFTITGWVIDQSNIITIYLYRSMTHQDLKKPQGISSVLEKTLRLSGDVTENGLPNSDTITSNINNNYNISLGSWSATPYTLGQLIVSIVAVFVLFQGAILLLSRTIILLLCMIFSPIMLLPEGLSDITDKYRKIVMDNFTGNILLGPVFMFLVLIAVKIGGITTKLVGGGPAIPGSAPKDAAGFLGGILSSVLVIVVLQLAISASKSLSGSVGEKIGGVIGKYAGKAGGLAFNTGKSLGGRALGGVMNNTKAGEKINDWITKGSTKSGFRGQLFKGAQNYTNKYGLNADTKRKSDAEEIANTHHNANEHTKLKIRDGLEKRAASGDKTAKIALEQIDKKIVEKKNNEFKQNKDTRERETYEAEQKNKNNGGNSTGAATVTENTKPTNPPTQNSAAEAIPKENKERGIQLHNGLPMDDDKNKDEKNKSTDIVKHEYPVNNFTNNTDNQNNSSGNQAIHTDNLQVVADNIQLVTGGRMTDKAKENNARNINEPKGFISNGGDNAHTTSKPIMLPNSSRQEKNELGQQMKADINEANKIGSTSNRDIEDIGYEDVPVNK